MEPRGVSPVIATVLLIVVTVMLVSVVAVVSMGLVGRITPPVFADLLVENYYAGMDSGGFITIYFNQGDNLRDAFARSADGSIVLKNLVIRIDGRAPSKIILNDSENFTKPHFEVGDYLQVEIPKSLSFGSVISIAWKPTGQTLRYVKVA
jgi:flagellin-like protein